MTGLVTEVKPSHVYIQILLSHTILPFRVIIVTSLLQWQSSFLHSGFRSPPFSLPHVLILSTSLEKVLVLSPRICEEQELLKGLLALLPSFGSTRTHIQTFIHVSGKHLQCNRVESIILYANRVAKKRTKRSVRSYAFINNNSQLLVCQQYLIHKFHLGQGTFDVINAQKSYQAQG